MLCGGLYRQTLSANKGSQMKKPSIGDLAELCLIGSVVCAGSAILAGLIYLIGTVVRMIFCR